MNDTVDNGRRLFWASFCTLIAAGIGFSLRGSLLKVWGAEFGFTQGELGGITGLGLSGFGITIILFSIFVDRIGYGPLMAIAFTLHFLSGVVTLAATPLFHAFGKDGAYYSLGIGAFLFALANGTCEAVINPLTATLFPKEKTHWLNILHAGWPGGLILGALLGIAFNAGDAPVRWEVQISMFLIPTLIYGFMVFRQRFPHSEARTHGISVMTMLKEFANPILLCLLILHAMVGYVELGTDSWIANITGSIMNSEQKGLMLFVWTSGLMFVLRFFAGPIVHKISPLGLLFVGAVCGTIGLYLLGGSTTGTMCIVAATIYGFGKTYYWPTMLGVVAERFPKGGALTLGAMGGIGMLSAGFLGGPIIGYKQDYFASNQLREASTEVYERYAAPTPKAPLPGLPKVAGLDGAKVALALDDKNLIRDQLKKDLELVRASGKQDTELEALNAWWENASKTVEQDKALVGGANLHGGRMALKWTALVPAMMAAGYLLLSLYFKARGGYKQVHIEGSGEQAKEVD